MNHIPFSPISPLTHEQEAALCDVFQYIKSNIYNTTYADSMLTDAESLGHIQPRALSDIFPTAVPFCAREETRDVLGVWDPEQDNICVYPMKMHATWDLIQERTSALGVRVVTGMFPILWQLGPLLYYTDQQHGVTTSMLPPRNASLARHVIAETRSTCIVTTDVFAELLKKETPFGPDTHWILIVRAGGRNVSAENTTIEHHVVPGVAVGIGDGDVGYVPYTHYLHEVYDGNVFITSLRRDAFPLIRAHVGTHAHIEARDGVTTITYDPIS